MFFNFSPKTNQLLFKALVWQLKAPQNYKGSFVTKHTDLIWDYQCLFTSTCQTFVSQAETKYGCLAILLSLINQLKTKLHSREPCSYDSFSSKYYQGCSYHLSSPSTIATVYYIFSAITVSDTKNLPFSTFWISEQKIERTVGVPGTIAMKMNT